MVWFMVVLVVLVGGLLVALPTLSRRGTPLGVAVPADRLADPAVLGAIRRYQLGAGAIVALVTVAAAIIGSALRPEAAAAAPLVLIVAAGAWYVHSRGPILAAKKAGDWFAGAPAILRASVTPDERQRLGHLATTAFTVAGVIPFVALAYVGSIWSQIPERVPTHFDASMQADGWTEKGPALIALVIGMPLGLVLPLLVVTLGVLAVPIRIRGAADAEVASAAARAQRATMGRWLGITALALSVGMSVSTIASVRDGGPQQQQLAMYVVVGLILLTVVGLVVSVARAGRRSAALTNNVIDDDRLWKGGLLYVNPDDPALFVEKRTGLGMTINLGHPAGRVIGVVVLAVLAGAIALVIVSAAG